MSELEPTLMDVIKAAEDGMRFGTVSLTLKKAHGIIATVDITSITRRKVNGSAEALTIIGSMLKMLADAGATGDYTFTVNIDKGAAAQLLTHDFRRTNFKPNQYE